MQRFLIIPVILIAILSLFSCGREAEYAACFMSAGMTEECEQQNINKQLNTQCEALGVKCKVSCIIDDHPECHNNPCLLYNYEDPGTGKLVMSTPPFCTKECTPDDPAKDPTASATCGSEALCMPFLNKSYCVPREYVQQK